MSIQSGGAIQPLATQPRAANLNSNALRFIPSFVFLLLISVAISVATGCQSQPVAIDNVVLPYTTLKSRVLNAMPTGVRSQSPNGREITSNYFTPTDMFIAVTENDNDAERAYAKVTILGSSRPFDLNIQVFTERRTPSGSYEFKGEDSRLTKKMIHHLREALSEKKSNRNVIDDIRAF